MSIGKPFRAVEVQISAYHQAKQRRRRMRRSVFSAAIVTAVVFALGMVVTNRSTVRHYFAQVPMIGIGKLDGISWSQNEAQSSESATSFSCSVLSITDGDTLRCWDGTRVRLHAIAARERDETCSPGHPCPSASGAAATAKLAELASGQTLQCQKTGTSYNRVTAICRNEANVEINCALIQNGVAMVWPKFNAQRPICR